MIGKRPSACADGSKTDGGLRIDGGKADGGPRIAGGKVDGGAARIAADYHRIYIMRWLGGGLWGRVAHHELAHG